MEVQKITISKEARLLISIFMGEDYPFEIDYNWLMPVVEKIESLTMEDGRGEVNYVVTIETDYCVVSVGGEEVVAEAQAFDSGISKIGIVYECVVKFTEWYNLQKFNS